MPGRRAGDACAPRRNGIDTRKKFWRIRKNCEFSKLNCVMGELPSRGRIALSNSGVALIFKFPAVYHGGPAGEQNAAPVVVDDELPAQERHADIAAAVA